MTDLINCKAESWSNGELHSRVTRLLHVAIMGIGEQHSPNHFRLSFQRSIQHSTGKAQTMYCYHLREVGLRNVERREKGENLEELYLLENRNS